MQQGCFVTIPPGIGQGTRVQLDARRAYFCSGLNLCRIGPDEQRDTRAASGQTLTSVLQATTLPDHVQATFCRDFLTTLGHQTDMLWCCAGDDVQHLVGDRSLEVQRHGDMGLEPLDIFVTDVAPVFTQMEGDDVRARFDGQLRCRNRVRKAPATGIAHGGDMVDVHAQQRRVHRGQLRARESHGC